MRLSVYSELVEQSSCLYALLCLDAKPVAEIVRNPAHIAVVIDRSSSMKGPRLAQALSATRDLAQRLDKRDQISIVTFDGTADLVFGPSRMNEENKHRLLAELERVHTGAGTNLAAGIRRGAEALRSTFVRNAVSRLILLTDGQPSVGIREPDRLGALAASASETGITISTMGLGETFDDQLLADLARHGRGGFYYIAGEADIAAAFGQELAGVFAIAARDVEVLVSPHEIVEGADLLNRVRCSSSVDGLAIGLGDVAAGTPKQIMVRLHVPKDIKDGPCASVKLIYTDVDGGSRHAHIDSISVSRGRTDASQRVTVERLRLKTAAAVDVAWAKRASNDRESALATLAAVQRDVTEALKTNIVPAHAAEELLRDLKNAAGVILETEARREQMRRNMREKSQSILLGVSRVSTLPTKKD